MAFGMQQKVYETRPRKPYSKRRKTSFAAVPKYKREFKSQPSKNDDLYRIGIVLFILIIFVLSTIIPKWIDYERIRRKQEITYTTEKDNKAFNFLIKSGKKRLNVGAISGAYSEFKLAYAIRPNDKELNQLLLETLEILCLDYSVHCTDYKIIEQKLKNEKVFEALKF